MQMQISCFRSLTVLVVTIALAGCGRENDLFPRRGERRGPSAGQATAGAGSTSNDSDAADPRPVITAFGDSLTAGMGADPSASYPAVLERSLNSKGYRYRVVNAGVSGDTSSTGLVRVDSVLAYHPKIVILELGANDGLRGLPVETTRANLELILAACQQSGARVVLAGMKLPPNYGPEYIEPFERMFVELAQKYNAARVPFLLEGVAAQPGLMQADGLHPNSAGCRIVAANVMRVLEPLLEK